MPLRSSSSISDDRHRQHVQALVTALVEFQKAQCYFSCANQMAGLIYVNQVSNGNIQALQDIVMVGITCTIGLVPVVFSLTCINRYGRESWYLTALTFCSCGLSTAALIWVQYWWEIEAKLYHSPWGDFGLAHTTFPACGWTEGFISESHSTWCPNQQTIAPADPVNYLRLTWTSWVISVIWLFTCLAKKARSFRWWPRSTKSHSNATLLRWGRIFSNVVYYSSWLVAFAIQFYMVSQ
jgi:hypothetical protein